MTKKLSKEAAGPAGVHSIRHRIRVAAIAIVLGLAAGAGFRYLLYVDVQVRTVALWRAAVFGLVMSVLVIIGAKLTGSRWVGVLVPPAMAIMLGYIASEYRGSSDGLELVGQVTIVVAGLPAVVFLGTVGRWAGRGGANGGLAANRKELRVASALFAVAVLLVELIWDLPAWLFVALAAVSVASLMASSGRFARPMGGG